MATVLSQRTLEDAYQCVAALAAQCLSTATVSTNNLTLILPEYECIAALKAAQLFVPSKNTLLATFQHHFIARHCFYRFIDIQLDNNPTSGYVFELSIKGLEARTRPGGSGSETAVTDYSAASELKSFYYDVENFNSATEETVADLLATFWARYHALDQYGDSLNILGLNQDANWADIQSRYRTLAQQHHPDRGGSGEQFIEIQAAYVALKRVHKQ